MPVEMAAKCQALRWSPRPLRREPAGLTTQEVLLTYGITNHDFCKCLAAAPTCFQKIWSAAKWNPQEGRMWNYAKDSPFFGGLIIHPDIGSLVKKPKFDCVGLRRSKIDPMEFKWVNNHILILSEFLRFLKGHILYGSNYYPYVSRYFLTRCDALFTVLCEYEGKMFF